MVLVHPIFYFSYSNSPHQLKQVSFGFRAVTQHLTTLSFVAGNVSGLCFVPTIPKESQLEATIVNILIFVFPKQELGMKHRTCYQHFLSYLLDPLLPNLSLSFQFIILHVWGDVHRLSTRRFRCCVRLVSAGFVFGQGYQRQAFYPLPNSVISFLSPHQLKQVFCRV